MVLGYQKQILVVLHIVVLGSFAAGEPLLPAHLSLENRESMGADDLAEFVTDWDRSKENSLYDGPGQLVGDLLSWGREPGGAAFGPILRFNNREIVERVIDLYIAEYQRRLQYSISEAKKYEYPDQPKRQSIIAANLQYEEFLLNESIARSGKRFTNAHVQELFQLEGVEADQDYIDQVRSLALSIFSPDIYPYVWGFGLGSTLEDLYFAYVSPQESISIIVSATEGVRHGYKMGPSIASEFFFWPPPYGGGTSESEALLRLAIVVEANPEVAIKQRDEIVRFLYQYGSDVEPDAELLVPDVRAYSSRRDALRVLAVIGTPDDAELLLNLADQLPEDIPDKLRTWRGTPNEDLDVLVAAAEKVVTAPDVDERNHSEAQKLEPQQSVMDSSFGAVEESEADSVGPFAMMVGIAVGLVAIALILQRRSPKDL